MLFKLFFQTNSDDRPSVDNVLKVLETTEALISTDPKIEADWKSFHSVIKVPVGLKVDERTQCSRDLFKELTQLTLKAKSGQMVTGGTKLHDQKDTNLCAYFATMSALRHQLRKTVGTEKSGKDVSKIDPSETWVMMSHEVTWPTWEDAKRRQEKEANKYAGLEIDEYLEQRDKDEKRFERDLAVMIGCVCPRALSATFKMRHIVFSRT